MIKNENFYARLSSQEQSSLLKLFPEADKDFVLTRRQFSILDCMMVSEDRKLSAKEIGDKLQYSRNNTRKALYRLESAGYVQKEKVIMQYGVTRYDFSLKAYWQ